METHGYFGKTPQASDFLFHGLPMRMTDAWAETLAGWIAAARREAGPDWQRAFLTSPVWRFVLPRQVISPEAWIGLFAGSIDNVGREFPFTVMMTTDIDLAAVQPIAALDGVLDRVEAQMLAFIEGQTTQAAFVGELEACARTVRRDGVLFQAMSDRPRLRLADDEAAVCLSGSAAGCETAAYGWRASAAREATPQCLWWHDGSAARPADLCVSRGLFPPGAAVALFLGDWPRHGWAARRAGDDLQRA